MLPNSFLLISSFFFYSFVLFLYLDLSLQFNLCVCVFWSWVLLWRINHKTVENLSSPVYLHLAFFALLSCFAACNFCCSLCMAQTMGSCCHCCYRHQHRCLRRLSWKQINFMNDKKKRINQKLVDADRDGTMSTATSAMNGMDECRRRT